MSIETEVTRNDERRRYEIRTAEGRLAGFAEYVASDGAVEFTHTVVRDEFEGQGVGSKLARAALDEVRAQGLRAVPTCPFIKSWIEKHPDYADLVG
jgi:predicted GNAT family acetyltransferase